MMSLIINLLMMNLKILIVFYHGFTSVWSKYGHTLSNLWYLCILDWQRQKPNNVW